jgi:hypothetical protein
MNSGNLGWVLVMSWLDCVKVVSLGCASVAMRLRDVIEVDIFAEMS